MDFLAKFPQFVYCLFLFLVIFGLRATMPRTISIHRLLILPAIFTIWNLIWLSERIHEQFSLLPIWFAGLLGGAVLGWRSVINWKIKSDRKKKTLSLPGSWSVLISILMIFLIRIYFLYKYATAPKQIEKYYISDSALSGLFTGFFMGRAYDFYQKYKKG